MNSDFQRQKAELRAAALAKRDALSDADRRAGAAFLEASADVAGPVEGKVVSGFWPIRGEIDPRPLMKLLADRGARLALPVVVDRTRLEFRRWRDGEPLRSASFGLMEPGDDAEVLEPDVMLVPLSVFDDRLERIGYGAGYYDRAISRLAGMGRRPTLIGVAFSCQQAPRVPREPHDEPLDMILTEKDILTRADADDGEEK